ncbi:aldo/keto reductase [Oscillospiraceae bacterium MB08-C2-2]|nr:aldo/keto reductase [Oscillospiraceae bacterium MB08-C2-2]
MEKILLGKTGLEVTRTAFGMLPLQRVDAETAVQILRTAYEAGINFYDTARSYSDSEEKMGLALSDVRKNIIVASKSMATNGDELKKHLEISLNNMKTDYIDIYQLHNPTQLPDPEDKNSTLYALMEAKRQGMVRHIGISNHSVDRAVAAVKSGIYETMQFPFSLLSIQRDKDLVALCEEHGMGFIAMKALCGGLLTNARTAFAYLRRFQAVVPIWGIQRMEELEEILELDANPPVYDAEIQALVAKEREELSGDFCRGCGYCLPCPVEIPINMAARMTFLLHRSPYLRFLTPAWQKEMAHIEDCIECGSCASKCPYSLNTPQLLKTMHKQYVAFLEEHRDEIPSV